MGTGRQSNGFLLTPLREVETEMKKGDKMDNKIIGMLTMFTVASVLLGSVAFAVAPVATTVDTSWNGAGTFQAHFVSGDDAHADFWTVEPSFQENSTEQIPTTIHTITM